ncbi:MAG: M48 family metallopeptidase, partial [Patescibacteria group bacterium]
MNFWFFKKRVSRIFKKRRFFKEDKIIFEERKAEARDLVLGRIQELNKVYNYSYKKISIKNMISRWGSCSRNGNLSFNYRLVLLPPNLVDYVIVHELCHLGEFNHSRDFWNLVARTFPDYQKLKEELKMGSISRAL